MEELFKGFETLNALEQPAPMNVYPQSLPAKEEEDDSEHFPYIIVRITDGSYDGDSEKCKIVLIVGIYDERQDRQGNKIVLNVIQRIRMHLLSKRVIGNNRFAIAPPCDWTVYEDEDLHPYYVGAVETNWMLPAIQEEVDI